MEVGGYEIVAPWPVWFRKHAKCGAVADYIVVEVETIVQGKGAQMVVTTPIGISKRQAVRIFVRA